MKRLLILLIAMLCFPIANHAQNYLSGKIIYRVKQHHGPDTSKVEKEGELGELVKNIAIKENEKVKKALPYLRYELEFNTTTSIFEVQKHMESDNDLALERAIGSSGADGVFYLDIENDSSIHQNKAFGKTWLIHRKADRYDWEIKEETKEIQGFKCIKATATVELNRRVKGEVTAWFAPDLPFQYGPLGFTGLPGMILALERRGYYFYADEIELSKNSRSIQKPQKGNRVTREEYIEETNKYKPFYMD